MSPNTPFLGTYKPSQAAGQPAVFNPTDPSSYLAPGDNHGQLVLRIPPGAAPLVGIVRNSGTTGGPGTLLFIVDPAGTYNAQFYPDEDAGNPSNTRPAPVKGTYTLPQGAQPGVFRPTNPANLPKSYTHGQMVVLNPSAPINQPGRLEPNPAADGSGNFYPDDPRSTPAVFTPDSNPQSPVKGVFTPSQQTGMPGQFLPNNPDPNQVPPAAGSHGKIVPTGGQVPAQTGTLLPPTAPGTPSKFSPDQGAIFTPDLNQKNPIQGSVLPIKPGNPTDPISFIPDIIFQVPKDPTPGTVTVVGEQPKHGVLQPTGTGTGGPSGGSSSPTGFTFIPDPPGAVSGKVTPINNPYNVIVGTINPNPTPPGQEGPDNTGGSSPSVFKPYDPSKVAEGPTKATFTPDKPIGAPTVPGTLVCFSDPQKTNCNFKPSKPGTVPGKKGRRLTRF
jgi:hypothetical protein